MAFDFINSAEYNASSNTITVSKPTNTQDGDIMFALVMRGFGTINSVPTGWTEIISSNIGVDNMKVYYKVASSEGSSYSWGYTDSGTARGFIATYRGGFNTSDPIDVVSNTAYTTSDTIQRAASMTVSAINSPLIFLGTTSSSITTLKPSVPTTDWIEDYDGGSTYYNEICHMLWTGSGATGNMDGTLSSYTSSKRAFAIALNPEVASGNTSNFFQFF